GESGRGRLLDDAPAHPGREADPIPLDLGSVIGEDRQRLRIIDYVQAHLGQDSVRQFLDRGQPLLVENLMWFQTPGQIGASLGEGGCSCRLAGGPATGTTALAHLDSSRDRRRTRRTGG